MSTLITTTNTPVVSNSLTVVGSSGAGFLSLPAQSTYPQPAVATAVLSASTTGELTWDVDGRVVTLSTVQIGSPKTLIVPNANGRIVLDDNVATLTGKEIRGSAGNLVDANYINGFSVGGAPADGDLLSFNTTLNTISPLTMSATSPMAYSAGTISVSVGSSAGSVAAGNDPRFSSPRLLVVKESAAGAGEFTSIAAALATISGSGPSAQWVVEVHPGTYTEPPMVIPTWTTVTTPGGARIIPAVADTTLFTSNSSRGSLRGFEVIGLGGLTDVFLAVDSSEKFSVAECSVSNFSRGIVATSVATVCILHVDHCHFTPYVTVCIDQDTRAIIGPFICTVTVSDCDFITAAGLAACIQSRGPGSVMNISGGQIIAPAIGVGVYISDGSDVNIHGMVINGTLYAIHVDNLGAAPSVQATSVNILNADTYDLLVEHSGTVGSLVGQLDYLKVSQVAGASVILDVVDAMNAGVVATGKLFLGPAVAGDSISEYSVGFNAHMPLGVIYGGGVVRNGGLDVNIFAGYGYVESAISTNYSKYLAWADTTLSLPANSTRFVQVDPTGAVVADPFYGGITYIYLARVVTTAFTVEIIDDGPLRSDHPWTDYENFAADILGALYQVGSLVSTNISQQFSVSSGVYYYANQKRIPAGKGLASQFNAYYYDSSQWIIAAATTYDVANYNDITLGLVAIPAGRYTKHFIYINSDGANERYFLVYGQGTFATQIAAEESFMTVVPPSFTGDVIIVAGIVVLEGTAAAVSIVDHRPILNHAGIRAVAATRHGDLTGLLNDDHPQYLLTSGGRALTGNLNLGGNNITGLGLVDGVSVSGHAARHLPAGLDPLATAAPLADLTSATSNQAGTANSFARSDHSHSIDISGFSINSLIGPADVPHGGTGLASLPAGNFLVGNGTGVVDTTKVAPVGAVVGTTDAQTLSNKTATIAAGNILEASSLSGLAVSGPALANQVLIATSPSAAAWSYVTDSSLSGAVSAAHGGTGVASPPAGYVAVSGNPFTFTKLAPSGEFLGDTDAQTATNKTFLSDTNLIEATSVRKVAVGVTAPAIGHLLTATSATTAAWAPISTGSLVGVLGVPNGGTGQSSLTAGTFLVGAGVGAVDTTKVVPAGVVVGTTDTQVLSNKIMTIAAGNSVQASSIQTVTVSGVSPTANQVLVASSPTASAWAGITSSLISGVIDVPHGGTGVATLSAGNFLVGAGVGAVTTTKVAPSGAVVGDTDSQTLTNKSLSYATNTINAGIIRDVVVGAAPPTAGQVLVASSAVAASWGSLPAGSITGILPVANGGTGASTLTLGNFLVGNGTGAVNATKVAPVGAVVGTSDTQTLTNKSLLAAGGNTLQATAINSTNIPNVAPSAGQILVATSSSLASWQTLSLTSFAGILPVANGGTGANTLNSGFFLVGAGTSPVNSSSKIIPVGAVVGTTDTQTLTNKSMTIAGGNALEAATISGVAISGVAPSVGQILVATSPSAASWGSVAFSSISGTVPVAQGGTSLVSLTANRFLVGNGVAAVNLTKVVPSGAVLGDTDTQTLSNKTIMISGGNNVEATSARNVVLGVTAPTAGQVLLASSASNASWVSLSYANISGTLGVTSGGTGVTTLTSNTFLVGAGASPVLTSKVVPTGVVVGTTDTQILTNKTATVAGGNTIEASALRTVVVSATAPTVGQVLIASSGLAASWGSLPAGSITGVLPVANGGTGASTLTLGNFLVGNGTGAVSTTKAAPAGSVLGDTDTQSISNKTMTIAAGNTLEASSLRTVAVSGVAPTANQILVATSGTAAAWSNLPAASLVGVVTVPNGGTGASTLPAGNFLVGNGTLAVNTSIAAPIGAVLGTSDAQTITGKTILAAGNAQVGATHIQAVAASATAPTTGQILLATSATTAAWGGITAGSITGIIPVANGGTGAATLTLGNFLVGAGVGAVATTKVAPAGVVLGDTDTQILSNKTLLVSGLNTVQATALRTVVVGAVAPTAGQVLVATSGTAAAWGSLPASSLSGIVQVVNGGTGASTLTSGNFLVGAGIGVVTTTKIAPVGAVVGTTDTQSLSNKTMTVAGGNLIEAVSIQTVDVSAVAPAINQVLIATSATTAAWGNISFASLTGTVPVANGGTGVTTLTSGNFLVGAGVGAVVTTKVVPAGVVVGTTDTQTLTNKTMTIAAGNSVEATSVRTVIVSAVAPAANQVLIASSGVAAAWGSLPAGSITGVLPVANGGTGASTLTLGNFLVGNGTGVVATTLATPAGAVVGTSDVQTITGKTITAAGNALVGATHLQLVAVSGVAPSASQVLVATSGTAASWGSLPVGSLSGILPVANGGTGASTLTLGNFLVGAGVGAVTTAKVAPAGVVVGTSDAQILTNKSMTVAGGNTVEATSIRVVSISATAPIANQVLIASSGTAASWGSLPVGSLSGILPVANGGTGASTLTLGNFLVGAGVGAVVTTKVVPAGVVVGTTDTQTLSNKTMTIAAGNSVEASSIQTVAVSGVAPTAGQVLVASSGVAAAWGSLPVGSLSGVLPVANGGTGASALTLGNFLVGAGAGAVTTAKVAPSGTVVGTSDTQTLANKTLNVVDGNTVQATALRTVVLSVTAPTANQVLLATSGVAAGWATIPATALSGIVPVASGGTGASVLTTGNFLVGAGAAAVVTTKVAPAGVVVGTTDTQTLTNKTMTVAAGNAVQASSVQAVVVSGVAPVIGQALLATSPTAAAWSTILSGPVSSTNTALVRWNGITGKVVQDSTATLSAAGVLTTNSLTLGVTISPTDGVISDGVGRLIHTYAGTSSGQNTFVGSLAGNFTNTTSVANSVFGTQSAQALTVGSNNIIVGVQAAQSLTSGSNNIIIQNFSPMLVGGSNNILLGSDASGPAESGVIRIGGATSINGTYISGIYGTTPIASQLVFVDAGGRMGSAAVPRAAIADVSFGNGTTISIASLSSASGWVAMTNTAFAGTYTLTTNNANFVSAKFDDGGVPGQVRWLGAATTLKVSWGVSFTVGAIIVTSSAWRFSILRNGTTIASTNTSTAPSSTAESATFHYSRLLSVATNDVFSVAVSNTSAGAVSITMLALALQVEDTQLNFA